MVVFKDVVDDIVKLLALDNDGRNRLEWWLRDHDTKDFPTKDVAVQEFVKEIEETGETVNFIKFGLFSS